MVYWRAKCYLELGENSKALKEAQKSRGMRLLCYSAEREAESGGGAAGTV